MATWPTTLPAPMAQGYSIDPIDPVIRTDMEVGAVRARRRTAARQDKVSAAWAFSDAELQIFREWFDDGSTGAAGGSAWFNIDLRIGAGGSTPEEARFSTPPRIALVSGGRWQVTADLEVR
jgi:hypothetical protein